MATNNEMAAFEGFKFNLGDVVLRITDDDADRGIVIARSLQQLSAGISRGYVVAFESVLCNDSFEEFELRPWQRPVRM